MSNQSIINELLQLEAFADELKQRSYTLRRKLEAVSTASTPRKGKGLDEAQTAKLLAKRRKTIIK